jgi:HEPN domain-containing protein
MSFNPLNEVRYRYRLAAEHLERAERLYSLGDWVGVVSSSQMAVENFAKAVIAIFEVPTWGHDPSNQLNGLAGRLPEEVIGDAEELAELAREMAPEHGRSTYGEPSAGLVPSEIYREDHAREALSKARKAGEISMKIFNRLCVDLKTLE